MVTLDTLRTERRTKILQLAARRGAHSLRVFGAVARGEATESRLDLLVAWEPGRSLMATPGWSKIFRSYWGHAIVKVDRLYLLWTLLNPTSA